MLAKQPLVFLSVALGYVRQVLFMFIGSTTAKYVTKDAFFKLKAVSINGKN